MLSAREKHGGLILIGERFRITRLIGRRQCGREGNAREQESESPSR